MFKCRSHLLCFIFTSRSSFHIMMLIAFILDTVVLVDLSCGVLWCPFVISYNSYFCQIRSVRVGLVCRKLSVMFRRERLMDSNGTPLKIRPKGLSHRFSVL